MPRRKILVVAGLVAGLAGAATVVALAAAPASARSLAPHAGPAVRLAKPAARCPPGFRRHTITAKCVRIQPRFPLLSWF